MNITSYCLSIHDDFYTVIALPTRRDTLEVYHKLRDIIIAIPKFIWTFGYNIKKTEGI